MSSSHAIVLKDGKSGTIVSATLLPKIDVAYARNADQLWSRFLEKVQAEADRAGTERRIPGHAHWLWEKKVAPTHALLSYPTMAIECGGVPQGLMLLKTDGEFARIDGHLKRPLVYVLYLATAPWNFRGVVDVPRFRGVGSILLRAAVETSIDLEFGGRIGLHSLAQAESFYERHGLTCFGVDPEHQNLKYFELSAAAAVGFTRSGGHNEL